MKKFISLLLCLMLVLPLYVCADDTAEQPAAQSESQPVESQPTESKPAENQPAESQPAESQPSENKPDENKPSESQPSESKPEESKPAESQPSESKPEESKPTETTPSDHKHVWDVTYTIPATCTKEGAISRGCSACGAIEVEVLPVAGHKFSPQWTRKAAGHWHACTVCGEQGDFGKHYPGPAATEEKAQICLTCGYTLTAKKSHTHKYDTTWTSDETGHWYACSGCDEQKDFADHSFDNSCDPDCNICGYQSAAAHIYSGTWTCDETGHWDVCTSCQETSAVEPHIPDAEGQFCVACDFQLSDATEPTLLIATEHVHMGEGAWLTDDESHWKDCACGEETEKQPHIWDEGQEQEDSTILYTCKDCGLTRTDGEPKTGGISPLVWIGIAIAVLLAAAGIILWLLLTKVIKNGKHRK